jgi:hypothetical protein
MPDLRACSTTIVSRRCLLVASYEAIIRMYKFRVKIVRNRQGRFSVKLGRASVAFTGGVALDPPGRF